MDPRRGLRRLRLARRQHLDTLAKDRALYDDERQRLEAFVALMRQRAKISDNFAPSSRRPRRGSATSSNAPSARVDVRDQRVDMRLGGARTGKRAVIVEQLELDGLTDAFDLELWFGERVAVLGGNGVGKSHFLRLLGGDERVAHHGAWRLGAGVVAVLFHQTHEHGEWTGRTLLDILDDHDVVRGPAMGMLRRYELQGCAEQPFDTLSGGQQARSRSCCSSGPAPRCCCSTSRPRTSTWSRPKCWRPGWPSSPGRLSPLPTTAGSCVASTASRRSARTARSGPPRGPARGR